MSTERMDSTQVEWWVRIGSAGLLEIEQRPAGSPTIRVRVRVRPDKRERFRIHELISDEPLTPKLLRELRLGAMEQLVNSPDVRAPIFARLDLVDDDQLARARKVKRVGQRLQAPNRGRYGDAFYAQVAEAYRTAATVGMRPVPFISSEAGVPATTARRWVKEARRRGHLGPGRAGREGEVEAPQPKDA